MMFFLETDMLQPNLSSISHGKHYTSKRQDCLQKGLKPFRFPCMYGFPSHPNTHISTKIVINHHALNTIRKKMFAVALHACPCAYYIRVPFSMKYCNGF